MINTLFLEPGEKRIVVGDCYNYVAKCMFPCSIRVLNNFGGEADRFDNITSGFSFKLFSSDLYKLEVTNGIYGQDIKIYSGQSEVKGINEFDYNFNGFLTCGAQASNFTFLHLKNKSKFVEKINIGETSRTVEVGLTLNEVWGTESTTYTPKDMSRHNLSNGTELCRGYHTSRYSSTYRILQSKFYPTYAPSNSYDLLLPPGRGFIFTNYTVDSTLNININIQY